MSFKYSRGLDKVLSKREWSFDFFDAIYEVATILNLGLGVAIIVGGVVRFPTPTYLDILRVSNGHSTYWGVGILVCALLMVLPNAWFEMVGLVGAMVWHNMFGALFLTALRYPTTASTGWVVYFAVALICACLTVERYRRYRLIR